MQRKLNSKMESGVGASHDSFCLFWMLFWTEVIRQSDNRKGKLGRGREAMSMCIATSG